MAASFNESVYHPYTSLKYHTLLVAALLDNYRAGHEFADLRLIVDPAGKVVPFRTVFDGERFTLRIAADADGTVYVGSNDQTVYALAADSGDERWTYETERPFTRSSPAVVGGTVDIGTGDAEGRLVALREST